MTFSRQQSLRPKTVDPNGLALSLVEMLRRTRGEQVNIEQIRVVTALDFDTELADPTELENALFETETQHTGMDQQSVASPFGPF